MAIVGTDDRGRIVDDSAGYDETRRRRRTYRPHHGRAAHRRARGRGRRRRRHLDLAAVDDETFAEIHRAFLDHKVLFFRDQPVTIEQHIAFGRRFGDLEVHPFITNDATHPEVVILESTAATGPTRPRTWHSDVIVPGAARRWARCCGAASSPTSAATRSGPNMELAYEGLSDEVEGPDRGQGGRALDGEGVRPLDVGGGAGARRSRSTPASATRSCAPTPRPAGAASTSTSRSPLHIEDVDPSREQPPAGAARRPGLGAAVPVPVPLAHRQLRPVGQPLHAALRRARLLPQPPAHGAGDDHRRPAPLTAGPGQGTQRVGSSSTAPAASGGTIGGCLHQGGHEVVLIARGSHHDALAAGGLELRWPGGSEVLPIPAVDHPGRIDWRGGDRDVVLLTMKSQDTTARARRPGAQRLPGPGGHACRTAWPTSGWRCVASRPSTASACSCRPRSSTTGSSSPTPTTGPACSTSGASPHGADAVAETVAAALESSRHAVGARPGGDGQEVLQAADEPRQRARRGLRPGAGSPAISPRRPAPRVGPRSTPPASR